MNFGSPSPGLITVIENIEGGTINFDISYGYFNIKSAMFPSFPEPKKLYREGTRQAVTEGPQLISFDDEPVETSESYTRGEFYEESGYRLHSPDEPVSPISMGGFGRYNPSSNSSIYRVPDEGSVYARIYSGDYYPYLEKTDRTPFSLASIDVAEYSTNAANSPYLEVIGMKEDGSVLKATLKIDQDFDGIGNVNDFQTYRIDWEDVVRVEFANSGVSIDNIRVTSGQLDLNQWYWLTEAHLAWNSIYGWLYRQAEEGELKFYSYEHENWLLSPDKGTQEPLGTQGTGK
jgi:hypothetical protein